jgi:hypothetical protein
VTQVPPTRLVSWRVMPLDPPLNPPGCGFHETLVPLSHPSELLVIFPACPYPVWFQALLRFQLMLSTIVIIEDAAIVWLPDNPV